MVGLVPGPIPRFLFLTFGGGECLEGIEFFQQRAYGLIAGRSDHGVERGGGQTAFATEPDAPDGVLQCGGAGDKDFRVSFQDRDETGIGQVAAAGVSIHAPVKGATLRIPRKRHRACYELLTVQSVGIQALDLGGQPRSSIRVADAVDTTVTSVIRSGSFVAPIWS